jgi:(2Fe-2S) ferredoxin
MEKRKCPDGGTCHHECESSCLRVCICTPLTGVFPEDVWPEVVKEENSDLDFDQAEQSILEIVSTLRKNAFPNRPLQVYLFLEKMASICDDEEGGLGGTIRDNIDPFWGQLTDREKRRLNTPKTERNP